MKKYFLMFAIGFFIAVIALIVAWKWLPLSPSIRFGTNRAAFIQQMQQVQKLETASFTIEKIIEAKTDYGAIRQYLFGDQLLLIAHGNVVAGYDLTKLTNGSLKGTGTSVQVIMPQPEILSVTLDNKQTQVYDRRQGLLTKGQTNMEGQARAEAESAIRKAACDAGILQAAQDNAKKQLEILLKGAGFTTVDIVTGRTGACN